MGGLAVDEVFALFLLDIRDTAKPATHDWYKRYLASFRKYLPAGAAIDELKRHHVLSWIRNNKWDSPTQRAAITAVNRAFNWAIEQVHIKVSPLAGMKKPPARRRDTVLSSTQVDLMLTSSGPEFPDLLTVALETGCRPQEIRQIEARHVKDDVIELSADEAKAGEGRSIYLTPKSANVVKRLCQRHPDGPI